MKIPDTASGTLLIFSFILLISPYLAGADFGIFKIPSFKGDLLLILRFVGPIAFAITLILFIPLWKKEPDIEPFLQLDDFLSLPVESEDRRRHFLFEVAVRNPSEQPISVTKLLFEFDPPQRQFRAATRISTTYKINVTSKNFCFVQGHNGPYPAKAGYNQLNRPQLDIEVPCAQELGPKSVDRFRIAVDISKDFDLQGPMEAVNIFLTYNSANISTTIAERLYLRPTETRRGPGEFWGHSV